MYVLIVSGEGKGRGRRGGKEHVVSTFSMIFTCVRTTVGRAVEQRVLQRGDSIYVESGTRAYHRARGRLLAYTQVDG